MKEETPSICEHRFEMTKALAAAFASKSKSLSSNIESASTNVVRLADALVTKLEALAAGELLENPAEDTYEDA